MSDTLLIRADAGTRMGTGHVMRCLALAQAWQDTGGEAVYAMAASTDALAGRLGTEGLRTVRASGEAGGAEDAAATVALAHQLGAAWVVVDGYQFGVEYQQRIKDGGLRLLFLDDNGGASPYSADLVLNTNLHASEELYVPRSPQTRLLLGTRYALLRREFWPWRGWLRELPEVASKVLVTLGGSDPDNVTQKVIEALALVEAAEAVVVVGGSNPHRAQLARAAERAGGRVRLRENVTDMPELMAWADIAVYAGGSTCWEAAFLGLPGLMLVLAENQRGVVRGMTQTGAAAELGWHEGVTSKAMALVIGELLGSHRRRQEMSSLCQGLVDGEGVGRVIRCLRASVLSLRRAEDFDCRRLWEWANEAETRAASFQSEPIGWETHTRWFETKLRDPQCLFLIGLDTQGRPVGQVRFDWVGDEAEISVSLDVARRGEGLAVPLIQAASEECFRSKPVRTIYALIKSDNARSLCAFHNAGYREVARSEVQGLPAVTLVLGGEQED